MRFAADTEIIVALPAGLPAKFLAALPTRLPAALLAAAATKTSYSGGHDY
ncbi:hypothetical protein [Corynebacterium pseudodiphtheriticum]|nr:hypothetical protein [Corynebacterium pseudodiphtheriticum]MDK8396166.1 hypothetical protein [Corynebacterium pseudodiphtheriticum]